MIVEVREEIDIPQDFKWITLGQIKNLIGKDNIVNMDLRTVISCIPFDGVEGDTYFKNLEHQTNLSLEGSMLQSAIKPSIQNGQIVEILSWLANMKSKTDLLLKKRSLQDLPNWNLTENKISHKNGLFFDILWVDVEIMHREVAEWNQPIVAPCGQGIICFIVKKINGIYHFLAQAELECGNFDMYEIGPTVACVKDNHPKKPIPYLDYILNAKKEQVLFDSLQSEEGGRFFHEENRNIIVEADDTFPKHVPENYKWLTLNQIMYLIRFNNFINIGARSLISAIRFDCADVILKK